MNGPRWTAMAVTRERRSATRLLQAMGVTLALLLLGQSLLQLRASAVTPGNDAFMRTWARTDKPVTDGQAQRTWMWGPEAFTPVMEEQYAESIGGLRDVQYFDKSRMEINDPDADDTSPWYVTNGLLVNELMTGQMQIGDALFLTRTPADTINVAGDPDDPTGPTYATLAGLRDAPPRADNAVITQRVARDGTVSNDNSLLEHDVTSAHRVTVTDIDHQVASPFWEFMNAQGVVYEDGEFGDGALFINPFYATGYPVAEAYWANVKVANTYKDVLMQCFERRCLTWTPGNPVGWDVEAGNVGQHYYRWRYGDDPNGTPTATPTATATATATSTATATATSTPTVEPLPEEQLFVAYLSGDNEVPPVEDTGSGVAYFFVPETGASVRYWISVTGVDNISMAHIHLGAAGEEGAVQVGLFDGDGTTVTPNGVLVEGEFTLENLPDGMSMADLVELMVSGDLYVNVHSEDNPDGDVRGQIGEQGAATFSADLTGDAEVPPVATDASGEAFFVYSSVNGTLDFQLHVDDLAGITAAHIHLGAPNQNGAVVAMLFEASSPILAPTTGVLATGTLSEDDLGDTELEAIVFEMLTGNAYTNVHTTDHPSGEIRGQIASGATGQPQGSWIAELRGIYEVPSVSSPAEGWAVVRWNVDGSLSYYVMVAGLESATAAHIHAGAAGENGSVLFGLFSVSEETPSVENGLLAQGTIAADDPSRAALEFALITGEAYVNVHTADYPNGEIRGQLEPAEGAVYLAELDTAQVVPDGAVSDASGILLLRVAADAASVNFWLVTDDLEGTQSASLYDGGADENGDEIVQLYLHEDILLPSPDDGVLAAGTFDGLDLESPYTAELAEVLAKLQAGHTYVQIMTTDWPDGEIRGQVHLIG